MIATKIVLIVLAASCVRAAATSSGRETASKPASVYAYLADNTIVRTDAVFGTSKVTRLGKPPPEIISTGGLLARSRDHRIVWALVRSESTLVALTPDLGTQKVIRLPKRWSARAVSIGAKTGRLYIAYNIETLKRGRRDPLRSAHLAVFASDGSRPVADTLLRSNGGRSWLIWSLSLDPAERRAYITYHGSDTTGLDVATVDGATIHNCRTAGDSRGGGCWTHPHGLGLAGEDDVVASTGSQTIEVYDTSGTLIRSLDTGLENNHLMEFALDRAGDRLFAVGSCGYVPGFAVVGYSMGVRQLLNRSRSICGETLAFAGGDVVIVGKTVLPVPDPAREGQLLRIDAQRGAITASRRTASEPTDILAAP
ncbi:MAG: hypothetical protein ACJ757_04655 [Gaiellaceae bacterium]